MKIGDTVRIKVGDNPMLNGKKFTIRLYSATTGMYSGEVEGYKYMKHQKYHWFHPHELFELIDPHDDMWPEQPVEKMGVDHTLDSKLHQICETHPYEDEAVAMIKQAFVNNGWVNIFDLHNEAGKIQEAQGLDGTWNIDPYNHGLYNGMEMITSIYKNVDPHFRGAPDKWIGWGDGEYTLQKRPQLMNVISYEPKMTGQEWYDKFCIELTGSKIPNDRINFVHYESTIFDAAKKAAGIE